MEISSTVQRVPGTNLISRDGFTMYAPCIDCKKFLAPTHTPTCTTCKASVVTKPVTILEPRPKVLPPKKTYAKGPCGGAGHPPHCKCGFRTKNDLRRHLAKEEKAHVKVDINKELASHIVTVPATEPAPEAYETHMPGVEGRDEFDATQAKHYRLNALVSTMARVGRKIVGRYYLEKCLGIDLEDKKERWEKVIERFEEDYKQMERRNLDKVYALLSRVPLTDKRAWIAPIRNWLVTFHWKLKWVGYNDHFDVTSYADKSIPQDFRILCENEAQRLLKNEDMMAEIFFVCKLTTGSMTDVILDIQ